MALVLAAPLGAALAGETWSVKLREASVRAGPKHFRPVLATVRYDDKVEVLAKKDGWLEVRLPDGRKGFLHESATTDRPLPKIESGTAGTTARPGAAGGSSRVSDEEVALAGKGFTPQVERQYRLDHKELEAAFAKVDEMERRAVARDELDRFLADGGLGEMGGR